MASARKAAIEHKRRFLVFGSIGAVVFLFGLLLQFVLVRAFGLGHVLSFVVQGVVSVQLSFVLNRAITWRDRKVGFLRSLWRFNVQKALAQVVNLGLYAALIAAGLEYLLANVVSTALFTVVNYVAAHYWAFVPKPVARGAAEDRTA